ncbi:hypothetical protein ACTXT7_016886 [Hymenolepis weldensis]
MFPWLSPTGTIIRNDTGSRQQDENPTSSNGRDRSNIRNNSGSRQTAENTLSTSARGQSKSYEFPPKNREIRGIPITAGENSIRYQCSVIEQRGRSLEQENNLNRAKTEPKPEESKTRIKPSIISFQIDNSSSFVKEGNNRPEHEENLNKERKPNEINAGIMPSGTGKIDSFPLEENGKVHLEHESNSSEDVKILKEMNAKTKSNIISPPAIKTPKENISTGIKGKELEDPINKEKNSKEIHLRNKSKIVLSQKNPTRPDRKINLRKNSVHNNKSPENNSELLKQDTGRYHKVPEIKFDGTSEFVELPYSKIRAPMIFKRMVQVKHLPVDPMLKYHKQKFQFSMGFKTSERTDSIKTNSDKELDKQHRLWCQLEAMTGKYGMKFPKLIVENTLFPIVTREDTKKKEEEIYEWYGDGGIVHDPNERLWNWEGSMINSNLLRDKDGKPIFNPDLDIQNMSQSPDFDQGSLGPNEYDEQLRKLFIDSSPRVSDASDNSIDSALEYNEEKFLHSNFCHPLNNNRFNQYRLKRLLDKEGTLSNANRISQTGSQILDLMYREVQNKKPKKRKFAIGNFSGKAKNSSSEDKNPSYSDSKTTSGGDESKSFKSNSSHSMAYDEMNNARGSNPNNVNYTLQPHLRKLDPSKRTRFFRRSSSTVEKEEEKWRYYWRKSLRGGSSAEESRRIYQEILKDLEDEFEVVEEEEGFHSPDQSIHRSSSPDALTEAERVRKKTKEIRTRFIKSWMHEADHIIYHVQNDICESNVIAVNSIATKKANTPLHPEQDVALSSTLDKSIRKGGVWVYGADNIDDDSFRKMIDKGIQTRPPAPYWVRVGKTRKLSRKKASISIPTATEQSVEASSQPEKMTNEPTKSPSSLELSHHEGDENSQDEIEETIPSLLQQSEKEEDKNPQDGKKEITLSESQESEDWSLQVYIEGRIAAKSQSPKGTMKGQVNLPNQEENEVSQDRGMEFPSHLLEFSEEDENSVEKMEETSLVDFQLSDEDDNKIFYCDLDQILLAEKSLSLETEEAKVSYDGTGTKSTPAELLSREDMTLLEKVKTELTNSVPSKMSKVDENLQDKTDKITQAVSTLSKKGKIAKSSLEFPEKLSTQYLFNSTKSITSVGTILENPDEESPDKTRPRFHFAPNVVIGPAKPRPKRRNRYRSN